MGFLTKLFSKVFIAVHIEENECNILVQVIKGNTVKLQETKKYFLEKEKFSEIMVKYLLKWQNKYNLVYISTVLNGINQGASESCMKNHLIKIGVPIENVEIKCINNLWQTYADAEDIGYTRNLFEVTGLDLLYNTFSLINYFFKKEIKDGVLYILYRKTSLSLVVYKNNAVSFSAFFLLNKDEEHVFEDIEDQNDMEEDDDELDPHLGAGGGSDEELMFFEDDELDLDDLEDNLDDEPKETKKEEVKEVKEVKSQNSTKSNIPQVADVELNTIKSEKLFNLIKDSLDEFYKNSLYSSEFINKIVIADSNELSNDVISYLYEELMIEVERRAINIPEILVNISKEEVGN